jgi:hypothetical protein
MGFTTAPSSISSLSATTKSAPSKKSSPISGEAPIRRPNSSIYKYSMYSGIISRLSRDKEIANTRHIWLPIFLTFDISTTSSSTIRRERILERVMISLKLKTRRSFYRSWRSKNRRMLRLLRKIGRKSVPRCICSTASKKTSSKLTTYKRYKKWEDSKRKSTTSATR